MKTPQQAIIRSTVYLLLFFLVFVLPVNCFSSMSTYPAYEELEQTTAYPLGIRKERRVRRFADEITYYLETSEGDFEIRGEYDQEDFNRFMQGHRVSFDGNHGESGVVFWADQIKTVSFGDISPSVPAVFKHRGRYLYEMTQAELTAITYDPNGGQKNQTYQVIYNVCMILGGLLVYGLSIKGYHKQYQADVQKYGTGQVQKTNRRGKFLRPADKNDKP